MWILLVTTCFVGKNHSIHFILYTFCPRLLYFWVWLAQSILFFLLFSYCSFPSSYYHHYNPPNHPNHPNPFNHHFIVIEFLKMLLTSTFLQSSTTVALPGSQRGQWARSGRLHSLRAAHRLQRHAQWFDATRAGTMWLWTRPRTFYPLVMTNIAIENGH